MRSVVHKGFLHIKYMITKFFAFKYGAIKKETVFFIWFLKGTTDKFLRINVFY